MTNPSITVAEKMVIHNVRSLHVILYIVKINITVSKKYCRSEIVTLDKMMVTEEQITTFLVMMTMIKLLQVKEP